MEDVLEGLTAAIDALLDVDPASVTDGDLHSFVVGLQCQRARLGAVAGTVLARWDKRRVWASNGSLSAATRLSNDTKCSPTTARIELRRARHLASMPATLAGLGAGRLSLDHLDVLGRANQQWRHAVFADAEAGLVESCATQRFPDAVTTIAYWCHAADAVAADERAKHQRDNVHLWASPTLDGTVVIDGLLDPVSGEIFTTELNRLEHEIYLADKRNGVVRKGSQRRVAALVEMATRSATMPADGRRPAPLFVAHVGDGTVGAMCELAAGVVVRPGDLAPFIDTAVIESVLFDGPTTILSVSHRRGFTGAVRRAIQARDRHCTHVSGCDIPAAVCDVDHIVPYPDHPVTSQFTGRIECPPHNRDPAIHDYGGQPFPERAVTRLDEIRARLKWRYLHDEIDEQRRRDGAA